MSELDKNEGNKSEASIEGCCLSIDNMIVFKLVLSRVVTHAMLCKREKMSPFSFDIVRKMYN